MRTDGEEAEEEYYAPFLEGLADGRPPAGDEKGNQDRKPEQETGNRNIKTELQT